MSKHMFFWCSKSRKHRTGDVKVHKIGKKKKNNQKEWKNEQEEKHTENKVKKWNKKKEDENKNEVKNKKEENQRKYTVRQKEVLKMEAKNLLLNLKMQKQRIKTNIEKRGNFFWNMVFNWREKMRKHLLVNCFTKNGEKHKQKHNFYTVCFLWRKNSKKGKKETKPDSEKGEKGWWMRKRRESKQHISGRVFFLNPFFTSPKRKTQGEEIHLTKLQIHAKRKYCVWKRTFKKKKLDKKDWNFLNKKRTQRQENCNFVWKSQRQRKQNNTHKEKEKQKQKKKREHSKKRKEQKTPANRKDEQMTEKSETKQKQKFAIDSENTRRQCKNHPKNEKHQKTKKIMIYTGKNQKKDQINDNWMHMRLGSPNHVTTRRNGQQSVRSRTRSSTRVNLEIRFLFFKWVFFKKIQMIIFGQNLLWIKMCSPFQKKFTKKQF